MLEKYDEQQEMTNDMIINLVSEQKKKKKVKKWRMKFAQKL
jgi:hypothetical protein